MSVHPHVEVRQARAEDAAEMRSMWQELQHHLSEHSDLRPGTDGLYRSERLEHALVGDPGWQAWVLVDGDHLIGFAVARALDEPTHVLTALHVASTARRSGLGRHLAETVMRATPGRWAVAFQEANTGAARFWHHVGATVGENGVYSRSRRADDTWLTMVVAAT